MARANLKRFSFTADPGDSRPGDSQRVATNRPKLHKRLQILWKKAPESSRPILDMPNEILAMIMEELIADCVATSTNYWINLSKTCKFFHQETIKTFLKAQPFNMPATSDYNTWTFRAYGSKLRFTVPKICTVETMHISAPLPLPDAQFITRMQLGTDAAYKFMMQCNSEEGLKKVPIFPILKHIDFYFNGYTSPWTTSYSFKKYVMVSKKSSLVKKQVKISGGYKSGTILMLNLVSKSPSLERVMIVRRWNNPEDRLLCLSDMSWDVAARDWDQAKVKIIHLDQVLLDLVKSSLAWRTWHKGREPQLTISDLNRDYADYLDAQDNDSLSQRPLRNRFLP